MRNIKFRIWCANKKEWEKNNCVISLSGSLFDMDNRIIMRRETHILEFSTGLHDKNGKEIFEGDIVEIIHPCWYSKCKTEFKNGGFIFTELNNPVENSAVTTYSFMRNKWKIEVIGNIHDNPELLED